LYPHASLGAALASASRIVVNMVRREQQRVVPHLSYEDPFAALEWLCQVFGFTEARRFDRGDHNLTARLKGPDGGVVMISGSEDDFKEWMRERAPRFEEATGRSWPLLTHAISVFVDDVDAHFGRATQHGAAVLGEPKDQPWGVRSYAVLDPEGHQWEFAELTSNPPEVAGDAEDDN
jgi:PhnB protein